MIHKTISLADQIFERLESDILTGVYPIGSLLTELSLSEDLGVSRTPIREAIRRLEQEHLVESSSKGMIVLSITPNDAMVIYDIRIHVEGLAARACAENITDEQLAELKELLDLQEFYIKKGDSEKVKNADSQFHRMIYQFAGSPVYYDTLAPLHNKTQKFRKASVSKSGKAEVSYNEHYEIYRAIASRDPEKAEQTMKYHVEQARARLAELTDLT
ncbi:MAG: GntR family transcriptional regulator [Parasporobacterium sp.]|nr:GntR family transcriptional regulator [Parasporobacterium sp.]